MKPLLQLRTKGGIHHIGLHSNTLQNEHAFWVTQRKKFKCFRPTFKLFDELYNELSLGSFGALNAKLQLVKRVLQVIETTGTSEKLIKSNIKCQNVPK